MLTLVEAQASAPDVFTFNDDKDQIDEKVKILSEASAPLAQRLYEEESKKNESSSQEASETEDKDVVDADFEEVKEEKEQQTS